MADASCIKNVIDEHGISQGEALNLYDDIIQSAIKLENEIGRPLSFNESDMFARQRLSKSLNDRLLERSVTSSLSAHLGVEKVSLAMDRVVAWADEIVKKSGGEVSNAGVVTPGKRFVDPVYLVRSLLLSGQESLGGIRSSVMTNAEAMKEQWASFTRHLVRADKEVREFHETVIRQLIPHLHSASDFAARDKAHLDLAVAIHDSAKFFENDSKMPTLPENATPAQKLGVQVAFTLQHVLEVARSTGALVGDLRGVGMPMLFDATKVARLSKEAWADRIIDLVNWDKAVGGQYIEKTRTERLAYLYEKHKNMTGSETIRGDDGYKLMGNPTVMNAVGFDLPIRDGNSWFQLNKEFGRDQNIFATFMNQIETMSRSVAAMQQFGPDVVKGFSSVVDRMIDLVEMGRIAVDPAKKEGILETLRASRVNNGSREMSSELVRAFSEIAGETMHPAHKKMAEISAAVRSVKTMASLGKGFFSILFGDPSSTMMSSAWRTGSWTEGISKHSQEWGKVLKEQFGKEESAHIMRTMYLGIQDAIGATNNKLSLSDPGAMTQWNNTFFKWSGISWVSDMNRLVASRMAMRDFGDRAHLPFHELPGRMQNILSMNDISPAKWELMRETVWTHDETGHKYLMPELSGEVKDASIENLRMMGYHEPGQPTMQGMTRDGRTDFFTRKENYRYAEMEKQAHETSLKKDNDSLREELNMDMYRLLTDEAKYGAIDADSKTRFYALRGTSSGTVFGEFLRFTSMFKQAQIGMLDRVYGRAFLGSDPRETEGFFNLFGGARVNTMDVARFMAASTVLGYIASDLKDMASGKTPRPKTGEHAFDSFLRAFSQGGAGTLYLDTVASLLKGQDDARRHILGPVLGDELGQAASLLWNSKDPNKSASALKFALENTPFANVWWSRGALDYLFLWNLKDVVNPGAFEREKARLMKYTGQKYMGTPMGVE